jgi:hypothetical protein
MHRRVATVALCVSAFFAGCSHHSSTQTAAEPAQQPKLVEQPKARAQNEAPDGFTSLFDGKNLNGWHGRKGTFSPYLEAAMSPDEHTKAQADWNADKEKHWSVDTAKGEIVSDGKGVYLATDKNYGDFEFYCDWLMVSHNGDSGIYLRSIPQVQIWDPDNAGEKKNGADKGSGALWNNKADNPGKWPLVKADNPVGTWNSMHVKMVGSRVWVWLNDKQTVNGAILDNYFDKEKVKPIPATGPIELQTHGSEIRFRNVFIREIKSDEANAALDKLFSDGYVPYFNGKDFTGWGGPIENYEIVDGTIQCKPKKGGTIHTNDEFSDFEAKVEFKLPPAGNNGLAIRYPGTGDTAYVGMCEVQVLDDTAEVYKKLDVRQYCGSVYGVVAAQRGFQRPLGDWNFYHVTVKGHKITVELNGYVITDADVSNYDQSDLDNFMAKHAHPGLMRTSGSFGFAGHNDPVQFRNVQIKKIEQK